MPDLDVLRAWAAGFFDGDGSVCIAKSRPNGTHKSPTYRLQVTILNTDPRPLRLLKETWGGLITTTAPHGFGKKLQYYLRLRANGGVVFLKDILPYLQTYKRLQAKFGIQFQEGRCHRRGGRRLTTTDISWMEMHHKLVPLVRREVG